MAQNKAAKQQAAANAAATQQAELQAKMAREDAAQKALAERRDAAKTRAAQVAAYLKSGVTLEGSPMLITTQTTVQGEKNAANTIANAEQTAQSLLLQGKAGQQTVTRGNIFGTAATVLGSANDAKTALK